MAIRTSDQRAADAVISPLVTGVQGLILAIALLVIFTPFESEGSYISVLLPRFAAIAAVVLVAPLIVVKPIRQIRPAFVLLLAVLLHLTVVVPAPPLQLLAEWVGLIACAFLARVAVSKTAAFVLGLRIALVVNIIALVSQTALTTLQGSDIDIHQMIFPVSEGRSGMETFGGFIRNSGFHIEPGTYATWVAMMIVAVRLLLGRFGVVEWAAIASLLPTYSTAAVIYFGVFAVWIGFDAIGAGRARSFALVTVLAAVGAVGFGAFGVDDYLEARYVTETNEEEQEWRGIALAEYNQLPTVTKVLGFGHANELCDDCHFDDLGFGPNLVFRGGILAVFGLLVVLWGTTKLLGINNAILTLVVIGTAKAATNSLGPWLVLLIASEVGLKSIRHSGRSRRQRKRRPSRLAAEGF